MLVDFCGVPALFCDFLWLSGKCLLQYYNHSCPLTWWAGTWWVIWWFAQQHWDQGWQWCRPFGSFSQKLPTLGNWFCCEESRMNSYWVTKVCTAMSFVRTHVSLGWLVSLVDWCLWHLSHPVWFKFYKSQNAAMWAASTKTVARRLVNKHSNRKPTPFFGDLYWRVVPPMEGSLFQGYRLVVYRVILYTVIW